MDTAAIREVMEATIVGFSVLGGGMACASGLLADRALSREPIPATVAHQINRGIAIGFKTFWRPSIGAAVIMVMT